MTIEAIYRRRRPISRTQGQRVVNSRSPACHLYLIIGILRQFICVHKQNEYISIHGYLHSVCMISARIEHKKPHVLNCTFARRCIRPIRFTLLKRSRWTFLNPVFDGWDLAYSAVQSRYVLTFGQTIATQSTKKKKRKKERRNENGGIKWFPK